MAVQKNGQIWDMFYRQTQKSMLFVSMRTEWMDSKIHPIHPLGQRFPTFLVPGFHGRQFFQDWGRGWRDRRHSSGQGEERLGTPGLGNTRIRNNHAGRFLKNNSSVQAIQSLRCLLDIWVEIPRKWKHESRRCQAGDNKLKELLTFSCISS